MVMWCAFIMICPCNVDAQIPTPTPTPTLIDRYPGREPFRDNFAHLRSSDISGKFVGNIGSATPGAEYGSQSLLMILRNIDGRITELEGQAIEGDTVYQLIVSDLFMFDKKITDNTYSVFIPMPSGYRLKPEGVFAAWIAGWDEYANVEILYGSGYMIEGFLFRRDDYPYLAGWDAHGFVQLEPWTPYGIQDVEMHTVVDETEILGLEKMNVGDVLTY